MALGVQAAVIDGESRVLLGKHCYVAGWRLPSGGVEAGETCQSALFRARPRPCYSAPRLSSSL
jgi:ADP-ribose pyrophosphatase YjhB (NUDIX family)